VKTTYIIKSLIYNGYWNKKSNKWNSYSYATKYNTKFEVLVTIESVIMEDCTILKCYII